MSTTKISLKPRFGEGLSHKPTVEIIADFETTGLDIETFLVIDLGLIGVDEDLEPTFFLDTLVEHGSALDALNQIAASDFLTEMHTENGLVDDLERRAVGDARGMTFDEIEDFVMKRVPAEGNLVLGGSGVAGFDRPIIRRYMPSLDSRLTFTTDDVGNERRAYRRAVKRDLIQANHGKPHRGFEDARIHLTEIKAFRDFYRRAAALIETDDARMSEAPTMM